MNWLPVIAVLTLIVAPTVRASDALDIVVIGGAGMTGQRIVAEALDRGHRVTIVVRDPSRVVRGAERMTVVQGDVLDASSMTKIAEGHDAVVSAIGTARASDPDYTLYLRAAESLVGALRSLGPAAPRLIVVGGVGSLLDGSGRMVLESVPKERLPEHEGQKAALDYYRTVVDVRWTYVSPPGRLAPGERTGRYRTDVDRLILDEKGQSAISMEDYAVAIVDELERPQFVNRRYTVGY